MAGARKLWCSLLRWLALPINGSLSGHGWRSLWVVLSLVLAGALHGLVPSRYVAALSFVGALISLGSLS
jgi:hypothetical protein